MVDWDRVERLRGRGWDWERIAGDPKVSFQAEAGAGAPGRALRALYYQRRSRQPRRGGGAGKEGSRTGGEASTFAERWPLARVGYLIAPLFGVWFALALVFPTPVGTFLPAVPWLAVVFFIAVGLLLYGLLRTTVRWSSALRSTLAVGVVLGLVASGGMGLYSHLSGCPTLSTSSSGQPQGWSKAANPAWQSNGAPVVYFYGSVACPYCSASTWAVYNALSRFGTVTGWSYGHSSVTDNPSNIPEINLVSAQIASPYVSFDPVVDPDDSVVKAPPTPSCVEQAYNSAYDSKGSIPFIVVNGQYWHVGAIVNPPPLEGLTPTQVAGQIANQSGPAWDAVSPAYYLLTAMIVKSCANPPSAVAHDPNVETYLGQLS